MATNPIGYHISPSTRITFFPGDSSSSVKAQVSDVEGFVPVELPEGIRHSYGAVYSTADKVGQLLANHHFVSVYKENKVVFRTIPPNSKTWEKQGELPLPPHEKLSWITRTDGRISYAFVNTVTTWNPVDNSITTDVYGTFDITALAERPQGKLIVGDHKGTLYFAETSLSTSPGQPITEICFVRSNTYLISCGNHDLIVVDTKEKKELLKIKKPYTFFVSETGMIVTQSGKEIITYKYDEASNNFKKKIFENSGLDSICQIAKSKFLITLKKEKKYSFVLWELKKGTAPDFTQPFSLEDINPYQVVYIDQNTLAFSSRAQICFASIKTEELVSAPRVGNWGINDMIALSDGSVMYATDTRGAGIHIAQNDKIIFSKTTTNLLGEDYKISSLQELVDGSVVLKGQRSFFRIAPKIDKSNDPEYEIAQLKLQIKHDPSQLELYEKLASLHESDEKKYQTYLAGMSSAVKFSDRYMARRYYEKARKIKSEAQEPCEILIACLAKADLKPLHRQAKSDLLKLTQKTTALDPAKEKTTRTRLFLGEADFSYTEAFIKKHPHLANTIIATEYLKPVDETVQQRVDKLKKRGVEILFGIDATRIDQIFKKHHFSTIQWNCPFGDPHEREEFKKVIPAFFQAGTKLQLPGDEIHVTLVQPTDNNFWQTRQRENPIVFGSVQAGYQLIRKRAFGNDRYPGYIHRKTNSMERFSAGGEEQEFVFEKTIIHIQPPTLESALALRDPKKKHYSIGPAKVTDLKEAYFICSTDEDSDYRSD